MSTNLQSRIDVCPVCKDKFVYPVERYQMNDMEWRIMLFCPNCQAKRELIVDRETVRSFLKAARIAREQLTKQYEEMKKKNKEEEVERFISAVNNDHILPIDF